MREVLREFALAVSEVREVDRSRIVVRAFGHEVPGAHGFGESRAEDGLRHRPGQDLRGLVHEPPAREQRVSVVRRDFQRVHEPRPRAARILRREAERGREPVRGREPHPADPRREHVRILAHLALGLGSERAHRRVRLPRSEPESAEENLRAMLALVRHHRGDQPVADRRSQSAHLGELLGMLEHRVERVVAERRGDALGELRPDPVEPIRGEVLHEAGSIGGREDLEEFELELLSVRLVLAPPAGESHARAFARCVRASDRRRQDRAERRARGGSGDRLVTLFGRDP